MPIYKTAGTYIKHGGTQWLDCDDTPLEVGDEIEIIQRITDDWNIGVHGKVVHFKDYNYIGVVFEVESRGVGGTLNNTCPEHCGYNFYDVNHWRTHWKKVDPLPEADREEALIKKILGEAKTQPKVLAIDGKFYNLTLAENQQVEALVEPLLDKVADKIRTINQRHRTELQREKNKYNQTLNMPEIDRKTCLKYQLSLWKEDDYICYSMPFKYRPKLLAREHKVANDMIDQDYQEKLAKDLFLTLWVGKDNYIHNTRLSYDREGTKDFWDYNCAGTLAQNFATKNPQEVLAFRETYEKFCELINTGHGYWEAARRGGMPDIKEVQEHAHKVKKGQVWDVKVDFKEEPKKDQPATYIKTDYKIGDLVRVLKIEDGCTKFLGSIGKVINSNEAIVKVEFLFKNEFDFFTWNYKVEAIEPTIGHARSRVPKKRLVELERTTPVKPVEPKPVAQGHAEPGKGWNIKIKVDEEPEAKRDFKVGDRVMIAVPPDQDVEGGRAGVTNDMVGIITKIPYEDNFEIDWGVEDIVNYWSTSAKYLKLVPNP